MDKSELMENQALGDDVDGENGGQEGVVDPHVVGEEAIEGREGEEESPLVERGERDRKSPLGERRGPVGELVPPREPAREAPTSSEEDVWLTLGVPNPYTGKPFGSFKEFKDYAAQFQREQLEAEAKRTGKTVDELQEERENQSFLARKRQEEKAQREAVRSAQARQEFLAGDLQAFLKDHPDVDVVKLEQNPKFQKFAGDRLYRVPLGQLYDDFVEIVGDAERAALHKAAGRSGRSTGGGQGGGMEMLTPAQREALSEWNRDNPEMKMTPKEFLGQ